ncbi:sulfite exporter TauE/SafE family protein [Parahaliea mediterranea]|uniref:Probable membrane transporter protein n=1 Tax=Parahaliea mediterranea TaxID=651086 RepID=A0A939DD99_9GAMM|nr:sulfite exporter TauE/SafE family protein [Parahaliea mediterranea]MBN7795955.1 sulfite exporter TauE/SafE family protein [Parahaliea mediterranea]
MADLATWQYVAIACLFVWSGFVRSGLGFGGAVLTLPFLLMVHNAPLVYLPIIAVHLLVFSGLTITQAHFRHSGKPEEGTVNWPFLRHALLLMIVPKLIGVAGVLTLPTAVVSGFIFIVVAAYAVSYLLDRPFKSKNRAMDTLFLLLGGYVSGTSLIAAPLVVPVAASRVQRHQLRDTLFVLWFVLVAIKLAAFAWTGTDLQWRHHLWLLPCAAIGHVLGLRFHDYTLRADTRVFFRVLGAGLLSVSLVGLVRLFTTTT